MLNFHLPFGCWIALPLIISCWGDLFTLSTLQKLIRRDGVKPHAPSLPNNMCFSCHVEDTASEKEKIESLLSIFLGKEDRSLVRSVSKED